MGADKRFISILEKINDEDVHSGSYYAEYSLDPRELELSISINGCGNITLPISADTVEKMLTVTEPAKFGLRDQTLYDKDVRDTNEISANKISISYNDTKFASILDNIRDKLGLSEDVCLKPYLHNILVYSKGQFFVEHQDTEKLNGMLATLVIVLPSPHIGGALKIKHYGEEVECKSENINATDIKFIAFYSDCQHEVERIVDGYRVVATYNLIAESSAKIAEREMNVIKMHQATLKEAMLDTLKEYDAYSYAPIPCITYLLNHQYTKHGISWSLLRGADKLRVELIKKAAEDEECEVLLALLETRETWTTDGGYDYDDSNKDPEPEDLVDSEIDVVHAIDINSKIVKYDQSIREKAVCYHLPNEEFKPFETEYEGYMGNYGNTVDYWYHRAAVIIWKKSDNFALSFLNDPNSVIKSLLEVRGADIKTQLEKLWLHWSERQCTLIDLKLLLELAISVDDSSVAERILQYCSNISILRGANDLICKLFQHYRQEWAIKTLDSWLNNTKLMRAKNESYDKFSNIVQEFVNHNASIAIINKLVEYQINCIKASDALVDIDKPISLAKKVSAIISFIKELIDALNIINDIKTQKDILEYIISKQKLYPALGSIKLLPKIKDPELHSLLKTHISNSLKNEIDAGLRNQEDWSIDTKSQCKCDYCVIFNEFMSSKDEINKRWPIRQEIRSHIVDVIEKLEVPIGYDVEAKGSPHKLILVKLDSIHSDAKARFEAVCAACQKLSNESNLIVI